MEIDVVWWHWLVLGLLLCVSEILTPGFFIFFIGVAALVTGIINWLLPELPFTITGVFFIFFAVAFSFFGRSFYKKSPQRKHNTLNRRGEQYIGQTFTVIENSKNGYGKIKVGDTVWSTRSEKELKVGDTVTVKSVDGIDLVVD